MTCSQCWATIPARSETCPRCGAKATGARPSFLGLLKTYPWLGALLALSVAVTLWAVTRRPAPPPEPIAPAAAPVAEAPAAASAPEPEPEPTVWPVSQGESAPVAAPAPPPGPVQAMDTAASPVGAQRPDGTLEAGPGAPKAGPP